MSIPLAAQSWPDRAACRGEDTELWFPLGGGDPDPYAKATCAVCPVRPECLEFALTLESVPAGIWGGMTERERRLLKRQAS